jgi:hypothetical protein
VPSREPRAGEVLTPLALGGAAESKPRSGCPQPGRRSRDTQVSMQRVWVSRAFARGSPFVRGECASHVSMASSKGRTRSDGRQRRPKSLRVVKRPDLMWGLPLGTAPGA